MQGAETPPKLGLGQAYIARLRRRSAIRLGWAYAVGSLFLSVSAVMLAYRPDDLGNWRLAVLGKCLGAIVAAFVLWYVVCIWLNRHAFTAFQRHYLTVLIDRRALIGVLMADSPGQETQSRLGATAERVGCLAWPGQRGSFRQRMENVQQVMPGLCWAVKSEPRPRAWSWVIGTALAPSIVAVLILIAYHVFGIGAYTPGHMSYPADPIEVALAFRGWVWWLICLGAVPGFALSESLRGIDYAARNSAIADALEGYEQGEA